MLSESSVKRQNKVTKMFKKSKFYFFKINQKMDVDDL